MPKTFTWGPVGKKNCRAALRRHANFVFPRPITAPVRAFFEQMRHGVAQINAPLFNKCAKALAEQRAPPLKYFIGHTFLHLLICAAAY